MKGGNDEEKLMGPLFPRVHINDAEKGEPRAPPRNKMALYEQLSIPSQRFNSGSASMLPLPPNNSGSLVPSASSSHGVAQKRSLYSAFCNSPAASSHLAERYHSYSSGGMHLNTTSMNLEWRAMKPTKYHTSNAAGHLSVTANFSIFQSRNSKNEDDFRVPTFLQSRTRNFGNGQQSTDKEKFNTSIPNRQFQTACVKQLKENSTPETTKIPPYFQEHVKKPASVLTNGDKLLVDASSNPPTRSRISESVKGSLAYLNEENRSNLVDESSRLHGSNANLHHECRALHEKRAHGDGVSAEPKKPIGKTNACMLEGVLCSRPSPGDNHGSPKRLENVGECHEDECGALRLVDRNADISDTSPMDSVLGLDISPDDVVGVIGQKQFWRARRALVHQQRIFTVQVFELHRIIKVQRLFAASPTLLHENNLSPKKPSIEILHLRKVPPENVPEPLPSIAELKDDPWKPKPDTECRAENATGKLVPSLNSETNKELNTQQSNYKPCSENQPPGPKPAPWCFHPPPGNQWLVPVLSPSEGLIYKPYTGPCPPTAGFIAPVYGNCGPINLSPCGGGGDGDSDFSDTAYGIPASHQGIRNLSRNPPLGPTYFPPYGMPLMNPFVSSSAVEQVSPFARATSNNREENRLIGEINSTIPYQGALNTSSQNSGVNSFSVRNLQAVKDTDVQASTASSPSERVRGDALPLFPTSPTVQVSDHYPAQTDSSEHQTRVIKVIPHNGRSASESAARIFQSIQEERKQHD